MKRCAKVQEFDSTTEAATRNCAMFEHFLQRNDAVLWKWMQYVLNLFLV